MTEIQIAEYVEAVKEIGKLKAELAEMGKRLECSMRHDSDDDKWKSREHIKCERDGFKETVARLKKLLFRAVSHCDEDTILGKELVADIRVEVGYKLDNK